MTTRLLSSDGKLLDRGAPLSLTPIGQRELRIPDGVVLKGVNTTSYNTTVREQWGSSWSLPFMKRQVDNAVAVGANALRITCSVYGVAVGNYSVSQLIERYQQITAYADSLGLLSYPCAGGIPATLLTDTATFTAFLDALEPWVAAVSSFDSVIGFDGVNEAAAQFSAITPPHLIAGMLASVRGVYEATSPLATTFDRVVFHNYQWAGDLGYFFDPIVDFIDLHAYTEGEDPSAEAARRLFASKEGRRPVLVGEFGTHLALSSAERVAYFEAVRGLVESDSRVAGAFVWAAIDTADAPNLQWGLFSGDGNVERTDIANAFRAFPTER